MASHRPSVFLSSTFKDDFVAGRRSIPLRTRILEQRHTLPVDLWAYEHLWPREADTSPLDADTIIDRCFAGIKACDLFVFILSGAHGTGAKLIEDRSFTSYLELELFAAAILCKPILVLHYKNREPESPLVDAMLLLKRAFRSGDYCIGDEAALCDRWNEACRALARGVRPVGGERDLSLADGLSHKRTSKGVLADLASPKLRFLDGQLTAHRAIDIDRAGRLVEQVASGVRSVAGSEQTMPHGSALFRLWAAMRELMNEEDARLDDARIAGLWDQALGLWAAKTSWFGLHGHIWMGPLAAVNTQSAMRAQRRVHLVDDPAIREPKGARASAIYSIAQKVRGIERKLFHFRQTIILATDAADLDRNAQQGVLAIRGNANLAMFKLGLAWRVWDAAEDFRVALALRERSGASAASVGEMQVDLGLCHVLTGRGRKGLDLIKTGIDGLRSNATANGRSFLARGLRKQRFAARVMLRPALARASAAEIARITQEVEALDQARDLGDR